MTTRLSSLPQTMGEMAMQCIIDSSLHELGEIKFPSIEYSRGVRLSEYVESRLLPIIA